MKCSKKRTGRPTKKPKPGSRVSLGLKVTSDIKERLDTQAKVSGRTQSQEAELRLERSFWQEDLLSEVLRLNYGEPLAGVLMAVGETMKLVDQVSEYAVSKPENEKEFFEYKSWEKHPRVRATAFQAAINILSLLNDPSSAAKLSNPQTHGSQVGFGTFKMVTKYLSQAISENRDEKWTIIREFLGPLGDGFDVEPKKEG